MNLPTKFLNTINQDGYQKFMVSSLGSEKKKDQFVAQITAYVGESYALQSCDEQSIIACALKVYASPLPLEKGRGYIDIVPYGNKAQIQYGFKGLIQLAHHTGKFTEMNSIEIKENDIKSINAKTGVIEWARDIEALPFKEHQARQKEETIGIYADFKTKDGFEKGQFMTMEELEEHSKEYSSAYKSYLKDINGKDAKKKAKARENVWHMHKMKMFMKTPLRKLLSTWADLTSDPKLATLRNAYDSDMATYTFDEASGETIKTYEDNPKQDFNNTEVKEKIVITDEQVDEILSLGADPQRVIDECKALGYNSLAEVEQNQFEQLKQNIQVVDAEFEEKE